MKKMTMMLCFGVLVIFIYSPAQAVQLYLTFEGEVIYDDVDHETMWTDYGIPYDEQLYLGDSTYHRVLIDTEIISIEDRVGEGQREIFNASYVEGTAWSAWTPAWMIGSNEFNPEPDFIGSETHPMGGLFDDFREDSETGDSYFYLYNTELSVFDWRVGTEVLTHGFFAFGSPVELLTVTSITDLDGNDYFKPVPEPATLLLLGGGMIALAGFRKRLRS